MGDARESAEKEAGLNNKVLSPDLNKLSLSFTRLLQHYLTSVDPHAT